MFPIDRDALLHLLDHLLHLAPVRERERERERDREREREGEGEERGDEWGRRRGAE